MKKNMKIFCPVALTVFILVSSAAAQGTWTNYTNENYIYDIAIEDDYIWCVTIGGVVRWNKQGGIYTNILDYTVLHVLSDNRFRSLAVDADNLKWFGSWNGGVSSFDGTTWTTYTTEDGLASNVISAVAIDADNVKWFGTNGGLTRFDGTTWTTYTTEDGLTDNW